MHKYNVPFLACLKKILLGIETDQLHCYCGSVDNKYGI